MSDFGQVSVGTYRIAHLFADTGIEDEVLHTFGEVVRVGIDPEPNPFSAVIQADACDPPLFGGFDLAIAHPKCQRFSKATAGGGSDPEDHPNQIPEAREACQRLADHYIIENVPQAPLHSPVKFTGGMFGMAIHYPRAFETSFYIPQPARTPRFRPEHGPLAEQGKDGHAWVGTNEGWRLAKGYSYDWPARGLKRHAVPAPYLRRLLYWWLAAVDDDWSGPQTEQTRLAADGGRCSDGTDRYWVGDALAELRSLDEESAAVVCLDDAWARPKRGDAFGVEYPTHDFETTAEIISACREVLKPGGWLIADADDWLLPRLVNYLRENWGDAAETYQNGYRKVGGVTLTSSSGEPDRSTPGMYGSAGGYPVVFAHKGETDRRWSESARQIARRPQERYGWGSVKPVDPYEAWIGAITEPDETVVVPCAGTAPAAIAAERLGREWIAIDCEPGARDAYQRRRESELATDEQATLVRADGGCNARSVDTGQRALRGRQPMIALGPTFAGVVAGFGVGFAVGTTVGVSAWEAMR